MKKNKIDKGVQEYRAKGEALRQEKIAQGVPLMKSTEYKRDPNDPLDFLYDNEVHIDTDVEPIHKEIEKHFTRGHLAGKIRGLRRELKELRSA